MRIPLADLTRAVAEQGALRGRFVDNVYQCGRRTFLLRIKPGPVLLLIDLAPGRARVLVTEEPPEIPERPPAFGSILRGALRGAKLLGSSLPAKDRIVAIDLLAAQEPLRLLVEAFSSHSNLLLLDGEGTILRVLDGDAAQHRGNRVGTRYQLPPAPEFPPEESILPADLPDHPFAANLALDRLARAEIEQARTQASRKETGRILARLARACDAVRKDIRKLADPQELRAAGEKLLCHFAELRQGMKRFRGVPLDPKLSPPENLDRLFERARKAARARPILAARLQALEQLILRAQAGEAIEERRIPGRRRGKQPPRRPYRVFFGLGGERILVGKGGKDNDETTLKVAGPHDLFLHVRQTPGAHVIVPLRRGQEIGEQTLLDAAHLALHYSKMRNAASADITYTPRKNVGKPKGAKPGLVTLRQERVLRLRREPERLARLLMSAE